MKNVYKSVFSWKDPAFQMVYRSVYRSIRQDGIPKLWGWADILGSQYGEDILNNLTIVYL